MVGTQCEQGVTSADITKLDASTRDGFVLDGSGLRGLPIAYVGTGGAWSDLGFFDPVAFNGVLPD